MRSWIIWERDKIAGQLVDADIRKQVLAKKNQILQAVKLARSFLTKLGDFYKDTGIHSPYLSFGLDVSGRPGDRAGGYGLCVMQGEAWIEFDLGIASAHPDVLRKHGLRNADIITHTVARIKPSR